MGWRDAGDGRVEEDDGEVVSVVAEGVVPVELGIRQKDAVIQRSRRCNRVDVRVEGDPDFVVRDAAVGITVCRGEEHIWSDQDARTSLVETRVSRVPIEKERTHMGMPIAIQLTIGDRLRRHHQQQHDREGTEDGQPDDALAHRRGVARGSTAA